MARAIVRKRAGGTLGKRNGEVNLPAAGRLAATRAEERRAERKVRPYRQARLDGPYDAACGMRAQYRLTLMRTTYLRVGDVESSRLTSGSAAGTTD